MTEHEQPADTQEPEGADSAVPGPGEPAATAAGAFVAEPTGPTGPTGPGEPAGSGTADQDEAADEPAAAATGDDLLVLDSWQVALPATGDDRVDAALSRLADVDGLPPSEHADVYEAVHADLHEALADLDQA